MKRFIEVITSKGVVREYEGYYVHWNESTKKYEYRHILEPEKPEYTWEEGIFGTEKEAKKRVEYHNRNF